MQSETVTIDPNTKAPLNPSGYSLVRHLNEADLASTAPAHDKELVILSDQPQLYKATGTTAGDWSKVTEITPEIQQAISDAVATEASERENADNILQSSVSFLAINQSGHINDTGNPHNVTKTQLGLSEVDNTSDADKPVSTAQQAVLDSKSNTGHTHTLASLDTTVTGAELDADHAKLEGVESGVSLPKLKPPVSKRGTLSVLLPDDPLAATLPYSGTNKTDQLIHASVDRLPQPFGQDGHKYWGFFTPYKDFNDGYEDPVLMSSDNGVDWVEPTGINNPLQDSPGGSVHNADTHVIYRDGELHCVWTNKDTTITDESKQYRIMYSKVTQNADKTLDVSPPAVLLETHVGGALSPSIDGVGDGWGLWSVDTQGVDRVTYRYCSTLTGVWSAPVDVTLVNLPTGYVPWHAEVKRYDDGYVLLLSSNKSGSPSGNYCHLFLGTSVDGLTFEMQEQPLCGPTNNVLNYNAHHQNSIYRSSLLPNASGETIGDVWVTSTRKKSATTWATNLFLAKLQDLTAVWTPPHTSLIGDYVTGSASSVTDIRRKLPTTYTTAGIPPGSKKVNNALVLDGNSFSFTAETGTAGNTYAIVFELPEADRPAPGEICCLMRCHSIGIWLRTSGASIGVFSGGSTYGVTGNNSYLSAGKNVIFITDRVGEEVSMLVNGVYVKLSYGLGSDPNPNNTQNVNSATAVTGSNNEVQVSNLSIFEVARWSRSMTDVEMRRHYNHLMMSHG